MLRYLNCNMSMRSTVDKSIGPKKATWLLTSKIKINHVVFNGE
jgi:hypothetical protein